MYWITVNLTSSDRMRIYQAASRQWPGEAFSEILRRIHIVRDGIFKKSFADRPGTIGASIPGIDDSKRRQAAEELANSDRGQKQSFDLNQRRAKIDDRIVRAGTPVFRAWRASLF